MYTFDLVLPLHQLDYNSMDNYTFKTISPNFIEVFGMENRFARKRDKRRMNLVNALRFVEERVSCRLDDIHCDIGCDSMNSQPIFNSTNIPLTTRDSNSFNWSGIPTALDPTSGELNNVRARRKREQLESLISLVDNEINTYKELRGESPSTIVEFGAGSGHLGLIIAFLYPNCKVVLIERKEYSANMAKSRVNQCNLQNVEVKTGDIADLINGVVAFDLAVSLHSCGMLTDLILELVLKSKSSFVLVPCCYGQIKHSLPTQHMKIGHLATDSASRGIFGSLLDLKNDQSAPETDSAVTMAEHLNYGQSLKEGFTNSQIKAKEGEQVASSREIRSFSDFLDPKTFKRFFDDDWSCLETIAASADFAAASVEVDRHASCRLNVDKDAHAPKEEQGKSLTHADHEIRVKVGIKSGMVEEKHSLSSGSNFGEEKLADSDQSRMILVTHKAKERPQDEFKNEESFLCAKRCMRCIDLMRIHSIVERSGGMYICRLTSLYPLTCSPKNNAITGTFTMLRR